MEKRYYQKELETMPVEEIKKLQSEKLVKQVKHAYDNVEYYRNLMDEKGVKPEDIKGIEDISKLPFLTKADLRDAYPYGLMGKPLKDCVRIQSTSGTTGSLHSIHSMISISGKTAAQEQSSLQAEMKTMYVRYHTDTDSSQEVPDLTEDRTR